MDEPSAGLDVEERLRFKRILTSHSYPCPIIISTHIVEDVESTCDILIVLNKGKIIFEGTPEEVKAIAAHHVYELTEQEYKELSSPHYLVKISGENQKLYRILSDENLPENKMKTPEIEDGYMYLIKGSIHEL